MRSREFWALTRTDDSGGGHNYTRFAVLLAGFSILALITLVVIVAASLVSGDGSGAPATPFDSPSQTSEPTSTGPANGDMEGLWIDPQMLEDDPLLAAAILEDGMQKTAVPQFGTAARHIRQSVATDKPLDLDWLCPIVDHYNTQYSTDQAGKRLCSGGSVTPPPTGEDISLAVWNSETSAWAFDGLPADSGVYREGDQPPFLLTWNARPGEEYAVTITYDCLVGGVPAIDFLAGVESADAAIFEASPGPGDRVPDAAVPVPDTPELDADNNTAHLLYLYGGSFPLLPQGPDPAFSCADERTVTFPVLAGEETVSLLGSLRLAHSDDHRGLGAADVAVGISLSASVEGVGDASVTLEHGAVAR